MVLVGLEFLGKQLVIDRNPVPIRSLSSDSLKFWHSIVKVSLAMVSLVNTS